MRPSPVFLSAVESFLNKRGLQAWHLCFHVLHWLGTRPEKSAWLALWSTGRGKNGHIEALSRAEAYRWPHLPHVLLGELVDR